MAEGARFWYDKARYHTQENNPTEAYNKARLGDRGYWLETCGPTAAVNCIAAMGFPTTITTPGSYLPQPEEVLMDYFNDPRNAPVLERIRDLGEDADTIPENRVPQYYPQAVYAVFRVKARFEWGAEWHKLVDYARRGFAVQLNLKNPGHYIAVVAYDPDNHELIYHDSWGSRFADGKGGWNRRLTREEVETNVKPFRIVYGLPS